MNKVHQKSENRHLGVVSAVLLKASAGVLALLALAALLVGCGSAVNSSSDTTPNAEEVDGEAGSAPMPAPVDRACAPGEQGYVTGFALALAGYGCTEIVNRSGIAGGRSWCCASGAIATDTAGAGGGAS